MIGFRTAKEFSHFAVEATRVTPSFSARRTVGIVLSASQCSERSLVVVGFVLAISNLVPHLCGLPNLKETTPS